MPSAPKYRSKPREHRVDPTSAAGPSRPKPKPLEQRDPSGIPGISKLKASIRQTKRLLAKENLEPGLKIQTQRRLTSLEADLARAEKRDVEKKNGGRYHMVKFFERQKLLRIIKRLRKSTSDDSVSAGRKAELEQDLQNARIMLNYVLHYPNEKKYISLFPSTSTATPNPTSASESSEKLSLPPLLSHSPSSSSSLDKGEKRRLDILLQIRGMMERAELSTQPEDAEKDKKRVDVITSLGGGGAAAEEQSKGGKQSSSKNADVDEADDFFEDE